MKIANCRCSNTPSACGGVVYSVLLNKTGKEMLFAVTTPAIKYLKLGMTYIIAWIPAAVYPVLDTGPE